MMSLLPNLKELAIMLSDPAIAQPAREVIRGLIERVAVRWEDGQAVVVLDGALTALIGLAQNAKGQALAESYVSSVKLVAGAGFGLTRTFGRVVRTIPQAKSHANTAPREARCY